MFTSFSLLMVLILAFFIGTLLFVWSDFGRLSKARRLVSEGALLVDVDPAVTFARDHVKGAVNIPLDDLPRRAAELDPHKSVVVCGRGKRQANRAARMLRSLGFYDVISIGRARF